MGRVNFVTGITGLVGSHVVLKLLQNGQHVRGLVRAGSNLKPLENILKRHGVSLDRLETIEGDLEDLSNHENLLAGVDHVYHCAAMVSYSPAKRSRMMRINVEGTAQLVNLSLSSGIKRFGYVSSIAALGQPNKDRLVTEESQWAPNENTSGYAISKHYSEREVWRGIQEGLSAAIINPGIIIGPGYWTKSSSNLFSKVHQGLKHYTTGSTGFIDVNDVADILIKLTESNESGERYTLVAEHMTFKDLFEQIAESINRPGPTKEANKTLANLAWRLEAFRTFFTGEEPLITRETAYAALKTVRFDTSKFKEAMDYSFTPLSESIKETGRLFLQDH